MKIQQKKMLAYVEYVGTTECFPMTDNQKSTTINQKMYTPFQYA